MKNPLTLPPQFLFGSPWAFSACPGPSAVRRLRPALQIRHPTAKTVFSMNARTHGTSKQVSAAVSQSRQPKPHHS